MGSVRRPSRKGIEKVPAKLRGEDSGRKLWTDEEIGLIHDTMHLSARRAAEHFPERSLKSVRHKREQVERGDVPAPVEQWTEEEDDFLIDNPHLTARQAAAALMRSYGSVRSRRDILNKLGHVFGGANKDPHRMGGRRLIAKTCIGCGLLLDASWFQKRVGTRGRISRCYRCRPDYGSPDIIAARRERQPKGVQESTRELQRASLEFAVNHGKEWTGPDHEILANPDMTRLEKAVRLGRTYYSIAVATRKFGYASKIGKGDPEKVQWRIFHREESESA